MDVTRNHIVEYNGNDYTVNETLLNGDNVKITILNNDQCVLGGVLLDHDLHQADMFIGDNSPFPTSYFGITGLVELQDLSSIIKYIVEAYTAQFNQKYNVGSCDDK